MKCLSGEEKTIAFMKVRAINIGVGPNQPASAHRVSIDVNPGFQGHWFDDLLLGTIGLTDADHVAEVWCNAIHVTQQHRPIESYSTPLY
jgi:hypothetical protein